MASLHYVIRGGRRLVVAATDDAVNVEYLIAIELNRIGGVELRHHELVAPRLVLLDEAAFWLVLPDLHHAKAVGS